MQCCNLCTGLAGKTIGEFPVLSVPLSRRFTTSISNGGDERRSLTLYLMHIVLHFNNFGLHFRDSCHNVVLHFRNIALHLYYTALYLLHIGQDLPQSYVGFVGS